MWPPTYLTALHISALPKMFTQKIIRTNVKSIIRKSLLFMIILFVCWGAYSIISYENALLATEPLTVDPNRPIQMSGMRYSSYYDSNLLSRVTFDNLQVRPRRFGPFKIQSINEVFIRNARIEKRPTPLKEAPSNKGKSSSSTNLSSNLKQFLISQKVGRVQRIIVMGLQYVRINNHVDGIISQIIARKAEYDLRGKKLVLTDAQLDDYASTRHLSAKKLEWSEKRRAWWVSGNATLREKKQPKKTLQNVWLNENLEILPLGKTA